ncbi:MAG: N-acetyltransferase [Thermodesulfovibrionales bacterium]|nr:N-acetyltransferase [Thermodesulfovibrionales bacterium]
MEIIIRKEEDHDHVEVGKLLGSAFEQDLEARLVDSLRKNPDFVPELSFIAECDEQIVGYILFFPIKIISKQDRHASLALAPMAVAPKYQRKGVGKAMVEHGLTKAGHSGFDSVIVLGHAEYYPRFGFRPASLYGINAPFEVPDEAFMALELTKDGLDRVSGTVVYPEEFNEV